jgi:hypothetical protein
MGWKDELSEDLQGSVDKFNSVDDLLTSYQNLEKQQSNSFRLPGPDATAEDKAGSYQKLLERAPELMIRPNPDDDVQMKAYRASIGVPDDIDGYEVGDVKMDDSLVGELKQLAVNNHWTKDQWTGYLKSMEDMQGQTQQNNDDARVRMGAELKTEWGLAYDDRMKVVDNYLQEYGHREIGAYTPQDIQAFYKSAVSLVGKAQAHRQPERQRGLAPDEAKAQLAEVNGQLFDRKLDLEHTNPTKYAHLKTKRIELMTASDPGRYS